LLLTAGVERRCMSRWLPAVVLAILVLGSTAFVATGQPAGPGAAAESQALDPSPAAQTGAALAPVEGTSPNTTRVLQLDGRDAATFASGSLSVTNAVRASTANAETSMQVYAVETALEGTDSPAARERILRNATDRMRARVTALEQREETARTEYRTGVSGAGSYLTVLGEVHVRAGNVQDALETLDDAADQEPLIQDELSNLQASTYAYTGPLTSEAGSAVYGEATAPPVFVAVSDRGMVIAAIRDGTYVRQAVRLDARDGAIGGVNLDAAQDRIATLYPWAWANNGGVSIRSIGTDVFRFQLTHGHGALDSMLDTSSGNVYREIHTKQLSGLPTTVGYTTSVNNTTLLVADTYAGGPLKVEVRNQTGAPLDATVFVNGTEMGPTGEDGTVWALSPAGTYNVTAESETEKLRVSVAAD
jgi:hypothetical protein